MSFTETTVSFTQYEDGSIEVHEVSMSQKAHMPSDVPPSTELDDGEKAMKEFHELPMDGHGWRQWWSGDADVHLDGHFTVSDLRRMVEFLEKQGDLQ